MEREGKDVGKEKKYVSTKICYTALPPNIPFLS